ncbi:MAG: BREX-1 system phosphatase PglZ type A [Candidatus Excrementavichristensenella sp.]
MDGNKIIEDLNRRFAAPLPEFYPRRIVVWYDEDREFEDRIDGLAIENANVLKLTGTNNFSAKKLLAVDDPTGNYLVYRPFAYETEEDNWLLDIELYAEEFRADLVSIWMDELGTPQTPALRKCFRKYRKFLNAQGRRNRIAAQSAVPSTPARLEAAIMAALAGRKDARPNGIIRAVLQAGLKKEENAIYQEFAGYGIEEAFWRMAAQGTGYQDKEPALARFAAHLLLTAAARTMREEHLGGLQAFVSYVHQAHCYDLVSGWMQSGERKGLYLIAEAVENELKLPQRFMKLQVPDLADTEVFPCVNEVILIKLMTEIRHHVIDVDAITRAVEKRRTCLWYDEVKCYYEGLLHVAKMQSFYKEHAAGFHTVEPSKVWEAYTTEYYLMDTHYRSFHRCYGESLKNYHPELSDLFSDVAEKAEGLYSTWFLGKLGSNWSDACGDGLREYGRVPEVPRQRDFYHRYVASAQSKVYVIVSDALRYEAAASLAEQLRRETQAEVKLSSMQGVFPTTTKFGMAALLPHARLSVEVRSGKTDRLAVLADGQSTDAPNRDKVLKSADPASVALRYQDIIGMKRAERQPLIKNMNVVYIYHDVIDEAGHAETPVFPACDTAIEELKNMVRIIVNEWGGVNIYITSDHGFLYTHRPLSEDDKVDKTTESDQDVEIGRRYAIMKKGAKPQYLLPVKFLDGETGYDAFAPRENIRIKTKGGGLNYVHGGISLQEMAVPVIEYRFLRNQSKEYRRNRSKYDTRPVEIALLSANRKITNMIFSLNFYQTEPVRYNREKATYRLYFADGAGKAVSDTVLLIADKTGENGQDRTFRCSFNLKPRKYLGTESYYLVIADGDGLATKREEFQIDIAFAVDGFDFFG